MGLAGTKSKRKYGLDPNNTKWTRNTDTFGQRMLRAQGWAPGQYLGVSNVPYACLHTEASASHIRVLLKDDNLGLGAKRSSADACTGLDAFHCLLGRLNGKTDETLEVERIARNEVKRSLWIEKKFGLMRFVRGGLLVRDQMNKVESSAKESDGGSSESELEKEKKKKRKTEDRGGEEAGDERRAAKTSNKWRKGEHGDRIVDNEGSKNLKHDKYEGKKRKEKNRKRRDRETETDVVKEDWSKSRKSKRRKHQGGDSAGPGNSRGSTGAPTSEKDVEASPYLSDAKSSKKFKRQTKMEKKPKRQDRQSSGEDEDPGDGKKKRKKTKGQREADCSTIVAATATGSMLSEPVPETLSNGSALPTPAVSATSTPIAAGMRHLARRRFITQKTLALQDQRALNQLTKIIQIFMIKS